MLRRLLATAGLVAIAAAPLQAQIPLLDIRVGAQAVVPPSEPGLDTKIGIGAYARIGVPVLMFKLMGSASYTRFTSPIPGADPTNMILIGGGPHFSPIPLLDLGLEATYDTDAKIWIWNPNVSVGFLMLEATAGYLKPMKGGDGLAVVGLGFRF